jgi:2,3-bisphosphoglycerate-independent phosphoglycerate mutase
LKSIKVAVLVPDGAADRPLEELGVRTPLEAASTPNMDRVASLGATGTITTVPPHMTPGSDVANFSLLGYDPEVHYGGRGPIEAANLGIEVPPGWTAFRCNLVATDGRRMLDYSAGHIGQDEASDIIAALERSLAGPDTHFYHGKSYRNILLLKGDFKGLECTPPHNITGQPLDGHLPSGPGAERVLDLMERSRKVLESLDVNDRLAASGRPRVDSIWPWGQGRAIEMESFESRFGLRGAVISAVDLVMGLGRLAGLELPVVPGMTGYLDTNYAGKGEAAVAALSGGDFVYVHVEAPDEASHMGSVEEKIKSIERFDELVVGPVLASLERDSEYRLMVCPDHPTLISTRTHDAAPVPYAVCGNGIPAEGPQVFSEAAAMLGGPHFDPGWRMMYHLSGREPWPVKGSDA